MQCVLIVAVLFVSNSATIAMLFVVIQRLTKIKIKTRSIEVEELLIRYEYVLLCAIIQPALHHLL